MARGEKVTAEPERGERVDPTVEDTDGDAVRDFLDTVVDAEPVSERPPGRP